MRWFSYLIIAILGALAANVVVSNVGEKVQEDFELIMFSTSLCNHCAFFDQDVAGLYTSHTLAKTAPLVRINLDDAGTGPYHLREPIEIVPTFIIMKNGKEQGRMSGLVDKFLFLSFVRDKVFPQTEVASRQ